MASHRRDDKHRHRSTARQAAPPARPHAAATPAERPIRRPPETAPGGGEWLYGRHAVTAALANPRRRIRRLVALTDAVGDAVALIAAARARVPEGLQPETVPREALEGLLPEGAVHQGLALAAATLPPPALKDVIAAAGPDAGGNAATQIVVLLDQVTDPHNVGAVLRSAAAFGALAVIVPEHGAPPLTGALAKAASGAVEHVPFVRVVNLARAMDQLKGAGFWCLGLDEAGERPLPALGLGGRLALVLGAEGDGMRRLTRERCDIIARLPTAGPIVALNVSNAAAIALYELTRAAVLAAGER
jgi:23S rRNA (guanosine2251-2'-O)-methyltransferase